MIEDFKAWAYQTLITKQLRDFKSLYLPLKQVNLLFELGVITSSEALEILEACKLITQHILDMKQTFPIEFIENFLKVLNHVVLLLSDLHECNEYKDFPSKKNYIYDGILYCANPVQLNLSNYEAF